MRKITLIKDWHKAKITINSFFDSVDINIDDMVLLDMSNINKSYLIHEFDDNIRIDMDVVSDYLCKEYGICINAQNTIISVILKD